MSDENPLERSLGKPLPRKSEVERRLGRPLSRPSLPGPPSDLDDEPMRAAAPTHVTLEHWPDEEAAAVAQVPPGSLEIVEGDIVEAIEWYFPLVWAAAVFVCAYIGIYYAVDQISRHNPLPPNFGM